MRARAPERPVRRSPVRGEHQLHRQLEQPAQRLDDLVARYVVPWPLVVDLEASAEVHERIAADKGLPAFDPEQEIVGLPAGEHIDAEREPLTSRDDVRLKRAVSKQPRAVGAVGFRHVHRSIDALHQAMRIAFVLARPPWQCLTNDAPVLSLRVGDRERADHIDGLRRLRGSAPEDFADLVSGYPKLRPVSSLNSRRTATTGDSPASIRPPGGSIDCSP
jgi:hypothetical protein